MKKKGKKISYRKHQERRMKIAGLKLIVCGVAQERLDFYSAKGTLLL